ncbi:MAG: hypothetical protein BroJett011_62210 [Chloroflexota bacterium]|nr:MAG: hypothetical protein BroJett011_62210 [Chloroflexota bacterium]
MKDKLRALWRRLTRPNDNIWLALLAALIGVLVLLLILSQFAEFFSEVLK